MYLPVVVLVVLVVVRRGGELRSERRMHGTQSKNKPRPRQNSDTNMHNCRTETATGRLCDGKHLARMCVEIKLTASRNNPSASNLCMVREFVRVTNWNQFSIYL